MKPELSKTFDQRCYDLLLQIPKGKVTTYREIAHALETKAYRAVGQAMNRNPNLVRVPCHRVVKSNGEVGGYAQGEIEKIKLLLEEGIAIRKNKILNLEIFLHQFR